ncbi:E3 SUMO-protein ligase ZBED1 [Labeo rohita]|uniref:E3 SUMO-protein ligase ZBED1 n=1 Tax=Labeo rohita TaxID=84645 RepID=A0ABQ8L0P7_LABRO|nr:E3 SUMO-protein ligase ZBED1 [Labeo rohita]
MTRHVNVQRQYLSEQESERLCPHPKKVSSPVWEFFGFKENSSLDSPICRKCHATVSAKGGNTTNLFTHLRVHHPLDYAILQKGAFKKREQARASGQLTIFESVERKRKADMTSACEDTAITKSLAYFIAKDMMPFRIVTLTTRSSPYPDQMVTAVPRIQSEPSPDGGSAPRDDLYSPECQQSPHQLDEPQRRIHSEDSII